MRDLEQIQLFNWKFVKQFCLDFLALSALSGNYCTPEVGERPFAKLPGDLGKEIHVKWKTVNVLLHYDNIGTRIQHIISKLKAKCTYIHTQKMLKNQNYGFYSTIYTPQQYGSSSSRKPYTRRRQPIKTSTKKKPKKTYYTRKSKARKPLLNKTRQVRKFKPKKNYSNTITCYACNEPGHLSSACPKRKNLFSWAANVVNCTEMDLIEIISDVSNESSIYSIVLVDDLEEVTSPNDYETVNELLYEPSSIALKYNLTDQMDMNNSFDELKQMMNDLMFTTISQPTNDCVHNWKMNIGDPMVQCSWCTYLPSMDKRATCSKCQRQIYCFCLKEYFDLEIPRPNLRQTARTLLLEQRVSILETRLNELETVIQNYTQPSTSRNLEDDMNKHINPKLKDIELSCNETIQDMKLTSTNTSPCNWNLIETQVWVKLIIDKNEIYTNAFIDNGASASTIDKTFLLTYVSQNTLKTSTKATQSKQFDGSILSMNTFITNIQVQFLDTCNTYSLPFSLKKTWVRDLNHAYVKLILGLNFLTHNNRGCILTTDFCTFFQNSITTPIISEDLTNPKTLSELQAKRGDTHYLPTSKLSDKDEILGIPFENTRQPTCTSDSTSSCVCPKGKSLDTCTCFKPQSALVDLN